jgi:hypothetical protein
MSDNFEQPTFGEEEAPEEEASNKNFWIGVGILGGIILLSVACLAVYAIYFLPKQTAQRNNQEATLVAQNVSMNVTLTAMQHEALLSQTPPATFTPTATNTPPIQATATATGAVLASTVDPQTATVMAAQTQAQEAIKTITFLPSVTPPASLPEGGIAEELGATGLVVMAIALVAVILLARRMRAAPGAR